MGKPEKHVFVCAQSRPAGHPRGSCAERGCQEVLAEFQQQFEARSLWGKLSLASTSCLGTCDEGPSVLVYPEGVLYAKVTKQDVATIIEEHLLGDKPVEALKAPEEVWG